MTVHPELTERAKRELEACLATGADGWNSHRIAETGMELLATLVVSEQQQKRLTALIERQIGYIKTSDHKHTGPVIKAPTEWEWRNALAKGRALSPSTPEENK